MKIETTEKSDLKANDTSKRSPSGKDASRFLRLYEFKITDRPRNNHGLQKIQKSINNQHKRTEDKGEKTVITIQFQ